MSDAIIRGAMRAENVNTETRSLASPVSMAYVMGQIATWAEFIAAGAITDEELVRQMRELVERMSP